MGAERQYLLFGSCLAYTRNKAGMSRAPGVPGVHFTLDFPAVSGYSGNRPSYIMESSPYTLPQFLMGIFHFFVASKVDRYSAFSRAVSLGNTLRWLLSRR